MFTRTRRGNPGGASAAKICSVAVMLDLIDEIERLRATLHRAVIDAP